MDVENLISEFKDVYNKEGKDNLEVQVPFLCRLADVYLERGRLDPRSNWTSILKVGTISITLSHIVMLIAIIYAFVH